jgi:hypothetical protein
VSSASIDGGATSRWYIDALDAAAGRAFITKRAEGQTLAELVAPPVFVTAPYFLAEPLSNPATALAAARAGFQLGVFTVRDRQVAFWTLEDAIEFVRRIYARVGGTGRDGGGERRLVPAPDKGGDDSGGISLPLPQRQKFAVVLRAIEDFSQIAETPDDKRKHRREEFSWRPIVDSIQPQDWDDLLDWGLYNLRRNLNSLRPQLTNDEVDALTQRYDDAVLAVGRKFHHHLHRIHTQFPWMFVNFQDSLVDRFDLLASIPSPRTGMARASPPVSLAEVLALVVATPVFVGTSLERLAVALVAASVLAHLPTMSSDGYVGNLGAAVLSAGRSGAVWLADSWPRVVQSKAAEEIIRDVTIGGAAGAVAGP